MRSLNKGNTCTYVCAFEAKVAKTFIWIMQKVSLAFCNITFNLKQQRINHVVALHREYVLADKKFM